MAKYIIAIDQGTSSTRAMLVDENASILKTAQCELEMIYREPGFVEQDAEQVYNSVEKVMAEILKNLNINSVSGIGITNQRETTIVWEKDSGKVVHNAIVWSSNQTQDICENLSEYSQIVKDKTGLPIDSYFSASKIRYILDNIEDGQKRAENGELLFGTIDSYLVYKLTNNHYTDYSNASRTLLFNIHDLKWDDELLQIFNIPKVMLPEVRDTISEYGMSKYDIPIYSVIGDQQSATFGQLCIDKHSMKATYGTGLFTILNTGTNIISDNNGLLSTILWKLGDDVTYGLEGSTFVCASAINWLKNDLKLFNNVNEIEQMITESRNDDVMFVPAFAGLATPYWNSKVKGTMYGVTLDTTKNDIVKATVEGIGLLTKNVIDVMEPYFNKDKLVYKVDGGVSQSDYLMQFQADLLNKKVYRPQVIETTALGTAFLAGLKSGVFKDIEQIKTLVTANKIFSPESDVSYKYNKYIKTIEHMINYYKGE